MKFIKCKPCDIDSSGEKCVFATYKKVIDDDEHFFCCERHANGFERKRKEP